MPPSLYKKNVLSINGVLQPDIALNYILNWFKSNISEYGAQNKYVDINTRCLMIKSGTGSGKSTAMVVEIFRLWRSKNTPKSAKFSGKSLICCQPKVLTAKSIATSIAKSDWAPDMEFPTIIGYHTGSAGRERPKCGLIYSTYGILSYQMQFCDDSTIMSMYNVIIIDEAHERSPENDILLMMLKNFYIRNAGNKNLPFLVVTSATFDPMKYAEYFNVSPQNVYNVEGISFPITTIYPAKDYDDYYQGIIDLIVEICKNRDDEPGKWDILIFVPSGTQMRAIEELLEEKNMKNILILSLTSEKVATKHEDIDIAQEDYDKLPFYYKKRRVILSTVVAETGLTLESLKYVIDAGFYITGETYPEASGLTTRPTTESRIMQRRGRVGRKFPGIFYPLYTESTRALLQQQNLPEIFTKDYAEYHLSIVKEQLRQKRALKQPEIFKIEDITLLDLPPAEQFVVANIKAHQLGFLETTEKGCTFTKSGIIASNFTRIKMECIRMVLTSFIYQCSMYDMITLCAIMMSRISLDDLMSNKMKKTLFNPDNEDETIVTSLESRNKMYSFKSKKMLNTVDNKQISIESILPPDARPLSKLSKNLFNIVVGGSETIIESHKYYYQIKLLLNNHFLEIMLLFDEFEKTIDDIDKCVKWCDEAGLDINAMMSLLSFRANLIKEFIIFDINRNDHLRLCNKNYIDAIEIIKNIKQCMIEGFKLNILNHIENNIYKSHHGQLIEIKSMLPSQCIDRMIACDLITEYVIPKQIYYNYLKLEENRKNIMYTITCPNYFY